MKPTKPIWAPLLACLLLSCSAREERPGIPARHLMLITVAGLRADHISAWQYQRPTTYTEIDGGLRRAGRALAIDDLAAEGVMFARTFAPSGNTSASLASLFSGCSPLETGVVEAGAALPEEEARLAAALQGAGFHTAAFVADGSVRGESWRHGFDVFEREASDMATLGRALDWVNGRDFGNGQGVFLWIHLEQPTFPFEPTEMDVTLERGGLIDFSRLFADADYAGQADGTQAFRARVLDRATEPLTPEDRDRVVALYDGELAQTNSLLQLFLDFYRYAGASSGVWERTMLVLAGTGGLELFESDSWGGTGGLTDPTLHVPLFLRHPDSLTGRRIFAQVTELQDLLPTLLDWCRLPTPAGGQGRSLLTVTDEAGRGFETRPAFGCRASAGRVEALTARDERWRLIWTPAAEEPFELIDQTADPLGLDDLSHERPDVVQRLLGRLRAWVASQDVSPALDLTAFAGG